ncbi:hypothetical protein HYH03_003715 [Edaphochlamys debaryana]|uniref:UspA domain-containing protein n=1 Tax=Edaphochlamys debaryana TaxID=47281 RepID=A0A836C2W5_9CHLO|nr:hypothetical protein HYH03_003715 [Edaphochlamys debaryana]|eukprot:KAG2498461.1 hypothetical protein HYH03_003715 [Edaphochlamys debaryana]
MHEFYRHGDTFHLVHVARIIAPQLTIHHQYHASYSIPDPKPPMDERAYVDNLREEIREKFQQPLDAAGIPSTVHLFVDTDNAPASAVCETLFKVAEQVNAAIIILAAHSKVEEGAQDPWGTYLGSVAEYATRANQSRPVMVIRHYSPPLVMHVSRSHGVLGAAAAGSTGGMAPAPAGVA